MPMSMSQQNQNIYVYDAINIILFVFTRQSLASKGIAMSVSLGADIDTDFVTL
jgi:hypothetical protein